MNEFAQGLRSSGPIQDPSTPDALLRAERAEQRLRDAIEALPQGIVFLDSEGRYILWNRQYAEIYHKSADLLQPGAKLADTLSEGVRRGDYPEALGREEEWLEQRLALLENPQGRHEQWLSDGRCVMIEERKTAEGGTIGMRVDITELKHREESFRLLFDSNPVPLLVYDPVEERFCSANDAAAEHFGYPVSALATMSGEQLFTADEWPDARRLLASSCSDKDRYWRQPTATGEEVESLLFTRQSMIEGRLATIVSIFDMTERRRAEARIAHMAKHDDLTGLANRAHCKERMHAMLEAARANGGTVATAMIDLDNFKQINDSYGHHAGDMVLREAARRMRALVPKQNALLCRLGGDEFAVVVRDASDSARMEQLAQTIIEALSRPYEMDQHTLYTGASVGVSTGPRDGRTAEMLIRSADLALYRAKDAGGGVVRIYEPQLHVEAEERRILEMALRKAVQNDEMHLNYQPVVDALTGALTGFEALLRWTHPQLGNISPVKFIPLAEEARLIAPIGEWVLRTACEEAARWNSPVRVAVNVSPDQLHNPAFVSTVASALANSGLSPERLELEVTESVFMREGTGATKVLERIMDLGVRLSLDDFGTGYSSLGYLSRTRFSSIKIDRSFVQGASQNVPEAIAIIRAVVALAQSLGMATTAEGVETEEEHLMVQNLGCTKVQGYYFGRPLPVEEARVIANRNWNKAAAA